MKSLNQDFLFKARGFADLIVNELNQCVTPYHAVNFCKDKLRESGFKELKETEKWNLKDGPGNYYFTRNNTTLVAFTFGKRVATEGVNHFKIIGTHTDSPVLKLAPKTKIESNGFRQLAVQTYGGGLWHTWFDRDLTLAGRVIVQDEATKKLEAKYFHHKEALLRIPNLAIHLTTDRDKFEFNKETHLKPIISTAVIDALVDSEEKKEEKKDEGHHFKNLLNLIANQIGSKAESIIDFELSLIDAQPSATLGINKEFISSPRLDNLMSSLCALHAITEHGIEGHDSNSVSMVAMFDHEEIGSESAQGAASNLMDEVIKRIFFDVENLREQQFVGSSFGDYQAAARRSLLISADMAHGVHPNYSEKHHAVNRPAIHGGVVIKTNANQRYATDSIDAAIIRQIAKGADVPIQDFIVKNDSPCGSTIGPIISAKTGIKTIDVGAPMLSMHSIRELCGVIDTLHYKMFFKEFLSAYDKIDKEILNF